MLQQLKVKLQRNDSKSNSELIIDALVATDIILKWAQCGSPWSWAHFPPT